MLSNRKLKELGRIPRSHEGHQEDALAAVERCGADDASHPKTVILFYSHRERGKDRRAPKGKFVAEQSRQQQL